MTGSGGVEIRTWVWVWTRSQGRIWIQAPGRNQALVSRAVVKLRGQVMDQVCVRIEDPVFEEINE